MKIEQHLADWLAAGVIDPGTADRIRAHEEGHRPERGIGVAEVLAYIGAVVILVGIGFFVGVEYAFLGAPGRIAIVVLVGAAALAAGLLMERRTTDGPSRRARAAAYFQLSPVAFYLVIEAGHDLWPNLYDPRAEGLLFMVAGLAGVALAIPFLLRTRAWPLAIALTISAYDAAGGMVGWQMQSGVAAEFTWIVAGLVLAGAAEVLRRRNAQLAPEILRFAALLPAVVVALFLSADFLGDATYLEPFAFVLALAGFAPALLRGSTGYAIAAGLGLFICVNEVGFRHFASQVGFPVVLIVSGIALLAIAGGVLRLLPQLRRRRAALSVRDPGLGDASPAGDGVG